MKFVKVKNGNYTMYLDLETGNKIRKNDLDFFDFLSNKGPDKIVRELKKLDDSTDGIGNLLEEENEETEVL